ncbi:hypothetical protein F5877DRAFT_11330, partial [Lentinula edodes]
RNPIPREWRRCRFCHLEPEDECHALLICNGNEALLSLRSRFIQQVYQALPVCQTLRRELSPYNFLCRLLFSHRITTLVAKYVYDTFEVYEST